MSLLVTLFSIFSTTNHYNLAIGTLVVISILNRDLLWVKR